MSDDPWLTLIGLGEDGPDGLSPASREALAAAEVVMGPPRHLSLLPDAGQERIEWPVPFADGLPILKGLSGRKVAVLLSGDPFWYGAGRAIAETFGADEFRVFPAPSTFSLAASRLGWPMEDTLCIGLHATPFERLRPELALGVRAIVLVRDGGSVQRLAGYLAAEGFDSSEMIALEALGGPRERVTRFTACMVPDVEFIHPVAVAFEIAGEGRAMSHASGLDDGWFETDGQITKRPMRALAMSALAPVPGERLWDIGGGSGSIAVEWCLSHPRMRAISIEPRGDRASRIRANADRFGLARLDVVEGAGPDALDGLPLPDAVFVGGGLSEQLLTDLEARLAPGTRIVAHAVTLETEALIASAAARLGGTLMRIEVSETTPLGPKRGWKAAFPVVQWRVTL